MEWFDKGTAVAWATVPVVISGCLSVTVVEALAVAETVASEADEALVLVADGFVVDRTEEEIADVVVLP